MDQMHPVAFPDDARAVKGPGGGGEGLAPGTPVQAGLTFGNPVLLQQPGAQFAARFVPENVARLGSQALGFGAGANRRLKVSDDLAFQAQRAADIERSAAIIQHFIDAGRIGQLLRQVGGQPDRPVTALDRSQHLGIERVRRKLALQRFPEVDQNLGIIERPMAGGHVELMALDQAVEVVVAEMGVEAAAQFDRAEAVGLKILIQAPIFVFKKAVVKPGVMGHEERALQELAQDGRQLGKAWRLRDHGVGNAGQGLNVGRNRALRIDERGPFRLVRAFHENHANLRDPIFIRAGARGFQVNKSDAGVCHTHILTLLFEIRMGGRAGIGL